MNNKLALVYLISILSFISFKASANDICGVSVTSDFPRDILAQVSAQSDIKLSQIDTMSEDLEHEERMHVLNGSEFLLTNENGNPTFYFLLEEAGKDGAWTSFKHRFSSEQEFIERFSCKNVRATRDFTKLKRIGAVEGFKYLQKKNPSITMGEVMLRMEWVYLFENKKKTFNLKDTLKRYDSILAQVKEIQKNDSSPERFFIVWKKVLEVVYDNQKENIDYCKQNTLLSDALVNGCTNCIGETTLFLSLFADADFKAPEGWDLSAELFKDHVRPILFNIKNSKIFDLTYAKHDEVKATVMSWNDYFYPALKGYNTGFHFYEEQFLNKYSVTYLHRPNLCLAKFDLGYLTRSQLINFSEMPVCKMFGNGTTPNGIIDNKDRLNFSESTAQSASNGGGPLDALKGVAGAALGLVLGGFLNSQGDDIGELLNYYKENAEKFSDNDYEFLSQIQDTRSGRKEFLNYFSKAPLLNRIGVVRGVNSNADVLLDRLTRNIKCGLLRPIMLKHKSEFTMENANEFMRFSLDYNSDIYMSVLQVEVSDINLYEMLRVLKTEDKFHKLIVLLEGRILSRRHILNEIYSDKLDQTLIKQHSMLAELNSLFTDLKNYVLLFEYISDCNYSSIYDNPLLVFSIAPSLKDDFQKIIDYKQKINNEPLEFLKSLQVANEQNKGAIILFPGKYADINALKLYKKIQYDAEIWFYKEFIDYFLFNEQYFFTGPEPENDDLFGKVRPFDPISFDRLYKAKIGRKNYVESDQVVVHLPKVRTEPCKPRDAGYVARGALFIYCQPGQEGQDLVESKQLKSEENPNRRNSDSSVRSKILLSGVDTNGTVGKSVPANYHSLTPLDYVDEVLLRGKPTGKEKVSPVETFKADPRQEVIIEPKHWVSLGQILEIYQDGSRYSVATHHLQRESIKESIHPYGKYVERVILKEGVLPGYLRFKVKDLIVLSEKVKENQIEPDVAAEQFYDQVRILSEKEKRKGITSDFDDASFKYISLMEVKTNLKSGWVLQGAVDSKRLKFDLEKQNKSEIICEEFDFYIAWSKNKDVICSPEQNRKEILDYIRSTYPWRNRL